MKKDWLAVFLPIWAIVTLVWMTLGFIFFPDAYGRPLIANTWALDVPKIYDPTNIDPVVAAQLGLIMGVPVLALFAALSIAFVQRTRAKRDGPAAPYK